MGQERVWKGSGRASRRPAPQSAVYTNLPRPIYDALMFFPHGRGLLLAVFFLSIAAGAGPESAPPSTAAQLSSAQIVEQMQIHDQARARELKHYHATRHYQVEYHGFPEDLAGGMVIEISFDAASGKNFRIVSQSGSNFLCEKVLKRAVDSEKEASQNKGSTALTPANYKFNLTGTETLASGPAYVLDVEPLVPSKFLYRGKIWVDASDFALAKMETHPSKSPSFWISRTMIQSTNAKTGGFWFPEKLRSETKVRIGGQAVFTIDYGKYEVESNAQSGPQANAAGSRPD
jgi:hypothetical protein